MEKLRTKSEEQLELLQQPISVERQVQFIQAALILVGVMLGNSFSQWFYMLDIIVGIGLMVTSLTGECFAHKMFARFPWNKPVIKNKHS